MIGEIVAVVPAADEEQYIGRCLDALQVAAGAVDTRVRVRIVVVLDSCRDGTAAIVAGYDGVDVVVSSARCVGAARALGADRAIATGGPPEQLWLAATDADSVVPRDWFVRMVQFAELGAQLVLGTVVPGAELETDLRTAWSALHRSEDGHRHVHGANLGIRADALVALGGWRRLESHEDVDLVDRAAAANLRIHRTGAIAVCTSARSVGRVPHGFSSYLRALG